jgi:hypothetical protein
MTYKGFNPVAFARSSATTLAKHLREEEPAMLRNFALGALLDANGRVSMNNGGEGFDWPVQYRLHTVEGNTGQTVRNFVRKNLWKTANLEYRGYQVTDSMFYRELKSNTGEEAIVKVYDRFVERLTQSMKQALGTEYYIDGSAAGNENSWHGLESMFAATQTINITDGTARAANAADKLYYPNDTYAGLSTVLGNYGGEQETGSVWPEGVADSEYDFWTPLIIQADSTAFGGATDDFAGQGDEVMRHGIIHSQRNTSVEGQITQIFLSRDFYIDLLNLLDDKEQINITPEHSLRAMGFTNVVSFDGVEVTWETGVPESTGYGVNLNCIELLSMDSTLFRPEGPEYDIHSQSFNAVVSTLSNLKLKSPRSFFKIRN